MTESVPVAYYNENDPFAAAWLRELIDRGEIAYGYVDERSIEDVLPEELTGYTQHHFFAGIGVWSYALRCAGWPDDRPVWTGSCPCQPFSAAGKRGGVADERHLWPAWFHLIYQCRPVAVFGEQVASKDGLVWLDLVHLDLEGAGYTVGAVDIPACGFGAPHIRNRLWFVGNAGGERDGRKLRHGNCAEGETKGGRKAGAGIDEVGYSGAVGKLGDACGKGREGDRPELLQGGSQQQFAESGAVNGFWVDAEWLPCRDGKARPVEPGTSPLVDGTPNRVGRLRGYGNAIVAPVAEAFIRAYMEERGMA